MRAVLATAAALVVSTGFACAQTASAPLIDSVPSITVEGTAKRDVRPDLATVILGVTTDRPSAADAVADNARAATAAVTAARSAGVAEADIQTSQLSLVAVLDQHDASKTRTFRASNQIALRIHDISKVGDIVGQLVSQGVNTIQDLDFQLANPAPVFDDLRAEATQEAQAQARIYAKAAGVALGRVLRIAPVSNGPMPLVRAFKMQATAAAPALPLEAGSQSLETHVQVTWELVPAAAPTP